MLNLRKSRLVRPHSALVTIFIAALLLGSTMILPYHPRSTVHATGSNPGQVSNISNVTQVAAGNAHSLFLKSDGTVWAVGGNGSGELGDGTTTQRCTVVQVVLAGGGALSNVVEIAAGASLSLARKSDGTVWSWGSNAFGQLGDGTNTDRHNPVQVVLSGGSALTGASGIAAGAFHGLALVSGSVKSWGYNFHGQLGDGTTTNRNAAVAVSSLTDATQIAAGQFHSLALRGSASGKLKAWGQGGSGQLGDTLCAASITTPSTMADSTGATFTGAAYVSGGVDFTVVTTTGNKVWTTGNNFSGQLGTGCSGSTCGLVKIGSFSGISKAVAGSTATHVLALMSTTDIKSWGLNTFGQLGDGTTTNQCSPVSVVDGSGTTITGFTSVSAGAQHSLAIKSDGTAWSWGTNSSCQLGR